jgi:hypothetical protein
VAEGVEGSGATMSLCMRITSYRTSREQERLSKKEYTESTPQHDQTNTEAGGNSICMTPELHPRSCGSLPRLRRRAQREAARQCRSACALHHSAQAKWQRDYPRNHVHIHNPAISHVQRSWCKASILDKTTCSLCTQSDITHEACGQCWRAFWVLPAL